MCPGTNQPFLNKLRPELFPLHDRVIAQIDDIFEQLFVVFFHLGVCVRSLIDKKALSEVRDGEIFLTLGVEHIEAVINELVEILVKFQPQIVQHIVERLTVMVMMVGLMVRWTCILIAGCRLATVEKGVSESAIKV